MSSEILMLENTYFCDPFPLFTDSQFEILQEIQENNSNPLDESSCFDQITSALISSSPPSVQFENLSLSQFADYALEVKTEEFQFNFDGYGDAFLPQSYHGVHETAMKFMQRSNSFENKPQSFLFRPQFDGVIESHNLQDQILSSPEGSLSSGQMRRVCSAGDLQKVKTNMQTRNVLSSSPLLIEEANFKVGRYSAEEKKQRIDRYRAKRTQRNFNKTIKYACRKTLADNRPRVRGRFARNDEAGEIPKASMLQRYDYEDDLWIDGFYEECEQGIGQRASFFNSFSSTQYQNFSYC